MRIFATIIAVALWPVLARAQGVILSPAPALWVNPANPSSYGVSIGPGYSGVAEYGIDLNGDGAVDFTLSADSENFPALDIIPSSSNAVLAYVVDSFGSSIVANLGAGTVVGPSSSLSPVWQQTIVTPNYTIYPNITFLDSNGDHGLFAYTSGFVGLQMLVDGEVHYGFLQIDCTGYSGEGGFYQGYGYNTVAGQPITIVAVPEPLSWALLAVGATLIIYRRRESL